MQNNCFGCTNRHIGCHGTCEIYKNFTEENQAKKREKLDEFDMYKMDRVIKENEFRNKIGRQSVGRSGKFANC